MCVPYRQLHFDPLRGTLHETRGRYLFLRFRVLETSDRSLRDFSHVRIVERAQFRSFGDEGPAQPAWIASLEGPVAWAGEAGDVQLHSNELRLREFGSRRSALRYAARVALSLGMRVLDSSDTGT
jgi:hypothetical protein